MIEPLERSAPACSPRMGKRTGRCTGAIERPPDKWFPPPPVTTQNSVVKTSHRAKVSRVSKVQSVENSLGESREVTKTSKTTKRSTELL